MAFTPTQNFLGRGWSFPPTFDHLSGQVDMLEGVADIQSSLHILLTTMVGERLMQPRFGCNLEEMIFESLDTTLKTQLTDKIETAILYFEPRIDLERVFLNTTRELEGLLLIEVDYRVRTTNSRFNFVFPFYKTEGTELLHFLTNPPQTDNAL
ncbi:GPW/gp25 family protein [Rufibacter psychrotolerans]|uniref:GPW/gp25 family protein n=1 Tax=Rufibacter psychrotolerans TaxID=2812556 RepID=UPI001F084EE7|nr:GPW/gp25 family protein [Rufibacter sp. SYSU D00308]